MINKLYDLGQIITHWTTRGSVLDINFYDLTKSQLNNWGKEYHNFMI
jgi:N6-adenosine-specific RNA methylase IME4